MFNMMISCQFSYLLLGNCVNCILVQFTYKQSPQHGKWYEVRLPMCILRELSQYLSSCQTSCNIWSSIFQVLQRWETDVSREKLYRVRYRYIVILYRLMLRRYKSINYINIEMLVQPFTYARMRVHAHTYKYI